MTSVCEMLLTFTMESWRLVPQKAKGEGLPSFKLPVPRHSLAYSQHSHTCRDFSGWWSCIQR